LRMTIRDFPAAVAAAVEDDYDGGGHRPADPVAPPHRRSVAEKGIATEMSDLHITVKLKIYYFIIINDDNFF